MPYRFYTVKPGDTLSQIADSWLGKATLHSTILNAYGYPLPNPDVINVGELLVLPVLDHHFIYTVEPGDTMSGLSNEFFGRAHLHNLILDQNGDPLADPDHIVVGQQLRIPHHASLPRSGLTPHAIANSTYYLWGENRTLFNGEHSYSNPDFNGDATIYHITLFAFGDINGRGDEDAAVVINRHTIGTTGRFRILFGIPSTFRPGFPGVTLVGTDLGDRNRIDDLYMSRQMVHLIGTGNWPDQTVTTRRFQAFGDAGGIGLIEVT